MKDQVIPHILRDRIIMYIKTHNPKLSDQQKAEYTLEIFDTYFKILNTREKELEIYTLFFSLLTNYNMFKWVKERLAKKDEDKAKVFDFIKNHAYSTNFEVRWKLDMSNLMVWRYNQNPRLQDDLDRLIFMLTGKVFIDIRLEIEQLNN